MFRCAFYMDIVLLVMSIHFALDVPLHDRIQPNTLKSCSTPGILNSLLREW